MTLVDINWRPSRGQLRVFALLLIVFFAIVSWLVYRWTDSTRTAAAIFAVAAAVAVAGLIVPKLIHGVYVVWMALAFPIGFVISHLAMALVYYGLFTPLGLLMRLFGRDAMQLRFDRAAKSYWKRRPETTDSKRYFRQF